MLVHAPTGRIGRIITEGSPCFARNTVDSLTTAGSLKDHGVEVYFEK